MRKLRLYVTIDNISRAEEARKDDPNFDAEGDCPIAQALRQVHPKLKGVCVLEDNITVVDEAGKVWNAYPPLEAQDLIRAFDDHHDILPAEFDLDFEGEEEAEEI